MSAEALMKVCEDLGIRLARAGDRLKVDAPRGVVTPELRADLTNHKSALIAILRAREEGSQRQVPLRTPLPPPVSRPFRSITGPDTAELVDPGSRGAAPGGRRAESSEPASAADDARFRREAQTLRHAAEELAQMRAADEAARRTDTEAQRNGAAAIATHVPAVADQTRAAAEAASAARADESSVAAEVSIGDTLTRLPEVEATQAHRSLSASDQAARQAESQRRANELSEVRDRLLAEAQRWAARENEIVAEIESLRQEAQIQQARLKELEQLRSQEAETLRHLRETLDHSSQELERERAEIEAIRDRLEVETRNLAEERERLRLDQESLDAAAEEGRRLEVEARHRVELMENERIEESRRQAEAESKRVEQEARLHAEMEEQRVAELEAVRRRLEEESRLRADRERRVRAEIEGLRRAGEDQQRRLEAQERLRGEAEARVKQEAGRRQTEEWARRSVEVETQRQEEAKARLRQEAERERLDREARLRSEMRSHGIAEPGAATALSNGAPLLGSSEATLEEFFMEEDAASPSPETNSAAGSAAIDQTSTSPAASTSETQPAVPVGPELQLLRAPRFDPVLEDARPRHPAVTPEVRDQLKNSDPATRAGALRELGRTDDDQAFELINGSFDDPATEVRNAAARALYTLFPDRAETFTRALREGDADRRRRIGAALATSGLAANAIEDLTGESRDRTYDAFSLLFLMAKAGEVLPLMQAIEAHPNPEIRLAVVKLLALSGQAEIVPSLRRLAVRGSLSADVRSAIMEAIYQISNQAKEAAKSMA
jgi:hypothetical protein